MNKTLIIGCGKLGIPLGQKLIGSGHQVTGLRRSAEKLPKLIDGISMDLEKQIPEAQWLAQFNLIYIILTPAERSETAYRKMYGHIIPQLVEQISQSRVHQRIIITSSTHVYMESQGGEVNEETPTQSYDYRSESLIAAEASLTTLHQHNEHKEGVCVRFSGLYTENSPYTFQQVKDKKPIPNPEHYMNRFHREDAVGFLYYLAQLPNPEPVYLASDDKPVQRKVFFKAIAQNLGEDIRFENDSSVGGKQCINQRLRASGYELIYPNYIKGYQLRT